MNRFRKEALIKYKAKLDKYTPLEIKRFEYEESIQARIIDLAKSIHIEKYPEEYDFMLDDHVDHAARRKGINPMSDEYSSSVAQRRDEASVSPTGDDGMPVSPDTRKIAYAQAERTVRGE